MSNDNTTERTENGFDDAYREVLREQAEKDAGAFYDGYIRWFDEQGSNAKRDAQYVASRRSVMVEWLMVQMENELGDAETPVDLVEVFLPRAGLSILDDLWDFGWRPGGELSPRRCMCRSTNRTDPLTDGDETAHG